MKITKKQLVKLIREAAHDREENLDDWIVGLEKGTRRYSLYDTKNAREAAKKLDDLMEEVAKFMGAAREKLKMIQEEHSDEGSGITDYEALDAIRRVFREAIKGNFKR